MQVVYETFVKQGHICNMNTEFHGLIEDDIKNGISLRAVRSRVLKYLVATRVIGGAGVYGHMYNLDIHSDRIKKFQTKFRDVTYYYTP